MSLASSSASRVKRTILKQLRGQCFIMVRIWRERSRQAPSALLACDGLNRGIGIGASGDLLCAFIERAQSGDFQAGQIDETWRIAQTWQKEVTLPRVNGEMIPPFPGAFE